MRQMDSIILERLSSGPYGAALDTFQAFELISCIQIIRVGGPRTLGYRGPTLLRALAWAGYTDELQTRFQCCPGKEMTM